MKKMYQEIYNNHHQYQYNDGRNPQTAYRKPEKHTKVREIQTKKGEQVIKQTDKKATKGPEKEFKPGCDNQTDNKNSTWKFKIR